MRKLFRFVAVSVISVMLLAACPTPSMELSGSNPPDFVPSEQATATVKGYIDSVDFNKFKDVAKALVADYGTKVAIDITETYSTELAGVQSIVSAIGNTDMSTLIGTLMSAPSTYSSWIPAIEDIKGLTVDMPITDEFLDSLIIWLNVENAQNATEEETAAFANVLQYIFALVDTGEAYAEMQTEIYAELSGKIVSILEEAVYGSVGVYGDYSFSISDFTLTAEQVESMMPVLLGVSEEMADIPVSIIMEVSSNRMNSDVFRDNTQISGTFAMAVDFDIVNERVDVSSSQPGGDDHYYDLCVDLTGVTINSDGAIKVKGPTDETANDVTFTDIYAAINAYLDLEQSAVRLEYGAINQSPYVEVSVDNNGVTATFNPSNTTTQTVLYAILDLDESRGVVNYGNMDVPFCDVFSI